MLINRANNRELTRSELERRESLYLKLQQAEREYYSYLRFLYPVPKIIFGKRYAE